MAESDKAELKISGMTCVNCVKAIEKSLLGLDGVAKASVNLGTELGVVEYDSSKLALTDLELAVTDAGYEVINEKTTIKVGGMTCVNCVNAIEKVLKKLDALSSFPVDLTTSALRKHILHTILGLLQLMI